MSITKNKRLSLPEKKKHILWPEKKSTEFFFSTRIYPWKNKEEKKEILQKNIFKKCKNSLYLKRFVFLLNLFVFTDEKTSGT